jgi:polysaccharide biosynthesis protein PslH
LERRRILFYCPYALDDIKHGGARRSSLMWRMLSSAHDVHLVVHARDTAPAARERLDALPATRAWRRFIDPRLNAMVHKLMNAFSPDIFWIEQFYCVPAMARIARRHSVPVVYSAQNVEADRFTSLSRVHAALAAWYEQRVLNAADFVCCVSARDRDILNARYGCPAGKIAVAPNAYDPAVFYPKILARDEKDRWWQALGVKPAAQYIVFVGSYAYAPNREAMDQIENVIAPQLHALRPDLQILMIGSRLPAKRSAPANLAWIGEVDDMAPCLHAADLLICPLLSGGGTRLKIIEALACGLPVVSTPKGAEGLDYLGPDDGLSIAPLADFAPAVVRELSTPRTPTRITEPLRRHAYDAVRADTLDFVDAILTGT